MKRFLSTLLTILLTLMLALPSASAENYTAQRMGFTSDVTVTLTFDNQGRIASIVVDSSNETPGFGTRCAEDEEFLNQFIGKRIPVDGVDVLSGATITSRAVIEAVNSIVPPEAFSIRNGVCWGMTLEEVCAAENINMENVWAENNDNIMLIGGENVKVSKFTAAIYYIFSDDQLFAVAYELRGDEHFDYLRKALESKYGKFDITDMTVCMDILQGISEDLSEGTLDEFHGFFCEDGTLIFIAKYNGRYTEIFYIDTTSAEEMLGIYNTFGL